MFFLDGDHHITRIAGSLAEWFDSEPSALVGEPITELIDDADVSLVETAIIRTLETGLSRTVACHFVADGERLPVDIELAPVAAESTLGTVIGTVNRTPVPEDQPESQLVQLRNFIELIGDATVVYELGETDPVVRAVNTGFEATFGYGAQHVVGEALNEYIVPSEYQQEAERFDAQVADGQVTTAVVERQTTRGLQEFSYRGLPIDHDGDSRYGLAIYADMTDTQQARQHLRVLHRVLRHNVRNELTVIIGMAEQILDSTTGETRDAAERILSRAENLGTVSEKARIAEDILGESPSDTVVDVGATTTEVVADARETWPDADIETDIDGGLPVATGLELRDALENIVDNAVRHNTESPSVRVETRAETPIHASTRATGQNAVVTVTDDGPGIPEHERAVIFDDDDITQLNHGSGLGLWVVRWIVESANGTVSYDRTDGRTIITLRLPLATDFDELGGAGRANQDSP